MLTTPRLRLRQWQDADYPAFAALNADPRVMQWMRAPLTPVQSDDMAGKSRAHIDANAWGLWAVEVLQTGAFAGCVGLLRTSFEASFTPCVEIMWRLAFDHWGKGYATESATAALTYGLDILRLPEIVSFTVPNNMRSRRVMERIGLVRDPAGDFDHPRLGEGHPLRRHVLYRTQRGHCSQAFTPAE